MFSQIKNIKLIISYTIILFINLLFTVKYFSRFLEFGAFLGFAILAFQVFAIIYLNKNNFSKKTVKYFPYLFITVLIIFTFLCHKYIKLESLSVDRWSVISSFFTELYNGNYPYYAKSHMGNTPGAMPVYFIIALPFYLIGELSILSVLGYIIFIALIVKQKSSPILIVLLSTSLFLYWEIATRSNLFTNSIAVLLVLNLYNKIDKNEYNKSFFLSAVISGLILSTRGIFILVYIITYISSFIKKEIKLKALIIYSSISVVTFLLTFLPLIINFKKDFFLINPFIVQSSFLIPQSYVLLFIIISIFLSLNVKKNTDKLFFSGISLFVAILIYFIYHSVDYGFNQSLFGNVSDISYFIFCIPFLFYFLYEESKIKKQ